MKIVIRFIRDTIKGIAKGIEAENKLNHGIPLIRR